MRLTASAGCLQIAAISRAKGRGLAYGGSMNTVQRVSFGQAPTARWNGVERRTAGTRQPPEITDEDLADVDFDSGRGVAIGVLGGIVLWAAILIPIWAVFF